VRGRGRAGLWVGALVSLLAGALAPGVPADEQGQRRERVFRIVSPEITESSSLFVSTGDPSLVYTTNDSGDGSVVYVLDSGDGRVVGRATLEGVEAVDVEALAGGDDGTLVFADIGDNAAARSSVTAYQFEQPGRGDVTVPAAGVSAVALRYADGPRDAEGAWYDVSSGRLYVVSKELVGASVYVSPPQVFSRDQAVLKPIADAPPLATDAAVLPPGDRVAIRTYVAAVVYSFPDLETLDSYPLPRMQQGESITAPAGGDVIWVGTEGERSPVVSIRLPARADPASPQRDPEPESADGAEESDRSSVGSRVAQVVLLTAGGGLVLLVAVALTLRRRDRR